MRILLFGAGGQLAHDLQQALAKEDVIGITHPEMDICDLSGVQGLAAKYKPNCLINTAAFNKVEDCEDQPERSFAVNAIGVYNLARAASQTGGFLVHFSTDYVFDGAQRTPYIESDFPNPQSIYGMSKLAGELIVRRYARNYFLVRTCGLYGHGGSGGKGANFVQTMLRLAKGGKPIRVVDDQVLTPTSTKDLAEKVAQLIPTEKYGLYHITNTKECSWYQFAQEIFRLVGLNPDVQPITSAAFGAKASRPPYSVLDNQALREAGFQDLRSWQDALADHMRDRKRGMNSPK